MKQYVVYSKRDCPWCEKAKALLEEGNYPHSILILGEDYTKEELQAKLPFIAKLTVPQIFYDGGHIGGYDELKTVLDLSEMAKKYLGG